MRPYRRPWTAGLGQDDILAVLVFGGLPKGAVGVPVNEHVNAGGDGGGVRADIAAGDITYEDIINVHPFGNEACLVETTPSSSSTI